ncbi:MAG: amino acid kinase [Gemmatimonadaceae bacterium]
MTATVDAVIKVGGALLELDDELARTLTACELAARTHALLVIPGGGPFADAVRAVDAHHSLSDDDAHWMAILGMEQFAILLVSRIRNAELVHRRGEIERALVRGKIPVLAPYRWLREADPLPHTWDVTSDSIAAWVATKVGARQLILIKPHAHDALTVVDRYFDRARAPSLKYAIMTPEQLTGSWFPD